MTGSRASRAAQSPGPATNVGGPAFTATKPVPVSNNPGHRPPSTSAGNLSGATRFAPGSHKLNRAPRADDAPIETAPMEAEAGSIVVFESRVWHKTGRNRTADEHRAGVFAWYTKPIYRTQENWFLSLRPEVRQYASEEALVLLSYKTQGLGLVHGASPA